MSLPSWNSRGVPDGGTFESVWGDWLSRLGECNGGWDWWVTLTFKGWTPVSSWTRPGWSYTNRAFASFIAELGLSLGRHRESRSHLLYWVRATEWSRWRGVPHFHSLIGGCRELMREDAWLWWYHRYGINRIVPYDRELGAGYYLCKYVTKDLGDVQFSDNLRGVAL